jgi:malonyl CoA-acyl carrier protein transacylase
MVDRLSAGEPYAVAFGGQGAAWLEHLEELVSSGGIESELATLVGQAELMLEPVPSAKHLTSAASSMPECCSPRSRHFVR